METDDCSYTLLTDAIAKIKGKRILVAPLNWGLGHATRCVPIIEALLASGKEVILAGDGFSKQFLQLEFPKLQMIDFSCMNINYSHHGSQVIAILKHLPHIISSIVSEHKKLQDIIIEHEIDTVISDNRFGLWCRSCESIYITHQLMVKMSKRSGFIEPLGWLAHKFFINRYDECWIPDMPGKHNLSGDLSHKYPLPKHARFIGYLSRFQHSLPEQDGATYDAIGLVSGPEPQRSIFEQLLLKHFQKTNEKALIVRGVPRPQSEHNHLDNITLVSHLGSERLNYLLIHTPKVICRSGYSTLMDLQVIQRTAILVPTPGQTEQEYLAQHAKKLNFEIIEQKNL